jgi:hypothetical protein
MEHHEFTIGGEFFMGEGRWRCTDVGTRTIAAIRLDRVEIVSLDSETGARRGFSTRPRPSARAAPTARPTMASSPSLTNTTWRTAPLRSCSGA